MSSVFSGGHPTTFCHWWPACHHNSFGQAMNATCSTSKYHVPNSLLERRVQHGYLPHKQKSWTMALEFLNLLLIGRLFVAAVLFCFGFELSDVSLCCQGWPQVSSLKWLSHLGLPASRTTDTCEHAWPTKSWNLWNVELLVQFYCILVTWLQLGYKNKSWTHTDLT